MLEFGVLGFRVSGYLGFKGVLQNFVKGVTRVSEGSDKGSMKETVRQRRETLHQFSVMEMVKLVIGLVWFVG